MDLKITETLFHKDRLKTLSEGEKLCSFILSVSLNPVLAFSWGCGVYFIIQKCVLSLGATKEYLSGLTLKMCPEHVSPRTVHRTARVTSKPQTSCSFDIEGLDINPESSLSETRQNQVKMHLSLRRDHNDCFILLIEVLMFPSVSVLCQYWWVFLQWAFSLNKAWTHLFHRF